MSTSRATPRPTTTGYAPPPPPPPPPPHCLCISTRHAFSQALEFLHDFHKVDGAENAHVFAMQKFVGNGLWIPRLQSTTYYWRLFDELAFSDSFSDFGTTFGDATGISDHKKCIEQCTAAALEDARPLRTVSFDTGTCLCYEESLLEWRFDSVDAGSLAWKSDASTTEQYYAVKFCEFVRPDTHGRTMVTNQPTNQPTNRRPPLFSRRSQITTLPFSQVWSKTADLPAESHGWCVGSPAGTRRAPDARALLMYAAECALWVLRVLQVSVTSSPAHRSSTRTTTARARPPSTFYARKRARPPPIAPMDMYAARFQPNPFPCQHTNTLLTTTSVQRVQVFVESFDSHNLRHALPPPPSPKPPPTPPPSPLPPLPPLPPTTPPTDSIRNWSPAGNTAPDVGEDGLFAISCAVSDCGDPLPIFKSSSQIAIVAKINQLFADGLAQRSVCPFECDRVASSHSLSLGDFSQLFTTSSLGAAQLAYPRLSALQERVDTDAADSANLGASAASQSFSALVEVSRLEGATMRECDLYFEDRKTLAMHAVWMYETAEPTTLPTGACVLFLAARSQQQFTLWSSFFEHARRVTTIGHYETAIPSANHVAIARPASGIDCDFDFTPPTVASPDDSQRVDWRVCLWWSEFSHDVQDELTCSPDTVRSCLPFEPLWEAPSDTRVLCTHVAGRVQRADSQPTARRPAHAGPPVSASKSAPTTASTDDHEPSASRRGLPLRLGDAPPGDDRPHHERQ